MDGKYHITYVIEPHPEGLTREQIPADGSVGACDCIVLYSVIGVPGGPGGLSTMVTSLNGQTGKGLTPEQEFQLWALWAHDLMQKLPHGGRRDLTSLVHSQLRSVALHGRTGLPETVEMSAIKHADGTVFTVPRPGRHNHVIEEMKRQGKPWNSPDEARHEQGFVTSTGRFVGRHEARKIAEAAHQLLERASAHDWLSSEDVW